MNEVHSSFLQSGSQLCLSLSTRWLPNARRTTNSGIGILNLELNSHRFGRCSIDWTVCRESLNSFDSPLDDHHLRWHRWIVSDHLFVERKYCSCIGLSCVLCVVLWFTGLRARLCLWKYVGESERELRLCVYCHHFAFLSASRHRSSINVSINGTNILLQTISFLHVSQKWSAFDLTASFASSAAFTLQSTLRLLERQKKRIRNDLSSGHWESLIETLGICSV